MSHVIYTWPVVHKKTKSQRLALEGREEEEGKGGKEGGVVVGGGAYWVAWRWESLTYAGTVPTASFIFVPRYASVVSFIFLMTMEDSSSGWNFLSSPMICTWIIGLSPEADSTLKDRGFMPACTIGSASFVSNTRRSDSMVCRGGLRPLVVVGFSGTLASVAKSTHLSIVVAMSRHRPSSLKSSGS